MILLALAAFTSAYTELNLAACEVLNGGDEWGVASRRCPGHAGARLYVNVDDDRFDLDAGIDNDRWESLDGLNRIAPRVEWRMDGGTPRAVIYRYLLTGADGPGGTVLAVETVGRVGAPGCLVALIGGGVPRANEVARARADAGARFRCGIDPVARQGVP
jgi:hypothetical protein